METAYYMSQYAKVWTPVTVINETKTQITVAIPQHDGTVREQKFCKNKSYSGNYRDPRDLSQDTYSGHGVRSKLSPWGVDSYDRNRTTLTFDAERALVHNAEHDEQAALDREGGPLVEQLEKQLKSMFWQGRFQGGRAALARLHAAVAAMKTEEKAD